MANYALFDVETVIDWQLVEDVEDCGKQEFIEVLQGEQKRMDPFVPYTYHVPAVIGVGLISSTGDLEHIGCVRGDDSEAICREFWGWLGRFQASPSKGTLVSFNGRSFDMPVLELAALRYGIRIPRQHFDEKYGNRYRFQEDWHLDLMDVLTGHGATRLRGGLALLSRASGLEVSRVAHSNLRDDVNLGQMQRWCRNDVRRLYVVFQRLQFMRGRAEELPEPPELEDESDG